MAELVANRPRYPTQRCHCLPMQQVLGVLELSSALYGVLRNGLHPGFKKLLEVFP